MPWPLAASCDGQLDPRIDAGRLRRALDDILAADALTPPISEAMKLDYLICMADLEDMSHFEATMRDFGRTLPLLGGRQLGVLDAFVPWAVRVPVQRFRLRRQQRCRAKSARDAIVVRQLAGASGSAGRAPGSARHPNADLDLCRRSVGSRRGPRRRDRNSWPGSSTGRRLPGSGSAPRVLGATRSGRARVSWPGSVGVARC